MNFFERLYGDVQGFISIWTKADKSTAWFEYPRQAMEALTFAWNASRTDDAYFAVCLQRHAQGANRRGAAATATVVPALFIDMDILDGSDAHKGDAYPATEAEARAFLKTLPIAPSFTVASGHGLHAYWLLESPINAQDAGVPATTATMKAWNDDVNHAAALHGWKFDMVCEPARILRVPGTLNHKTDPPVDVGEPEGDWTRYTFAEVKSAHETMRGMAPSDEELALVGANGAPAFRMPETVVDGGRNNTLYQYACSLRGKGYEFDAVLNGTRSANESLCKPPLPDVEVVGLARSACTHAPGILKAAGAKTGQDVAIVLPAIPEVGTLDLRELMSNAVLDTIMFAPDLVERQLRLAICQRRAREIGCLKGFNDLWKAKLSAHAAAAARADHDATPTVEVVLADTPIEGLRISDWEVDRKGVRRMRTIAGQAVVEQACPHPIVITERLSNVDSQVEKLRVAWCREGERWEDMVAMRSIVASRQGIVALSDSGIMVTSENSKYLVQYLHELEAANVSVIPKRRSVSRCGWIGTAEFAPYAEDITFDGDPRMRSLFDAVRAQGNADAWMCTARESRASMMARAIMAASFAAPLVWLLAKPCFFVHLWGQTGTGKTVAMFLAASVWGDPRILTKTFNSTGIGMERTAAFMHSLPLCLDEFQTLDKKKVDVDNMLYQLAEGKSKGRGTKLGGIEQEARWGNVILTNGEEPMTTSSSGGGAKNRTIELCIDRSVFADAPEVARAITANYGHAGQRYVDGLIGAMADGGTDAVRAMYDAYRYAVGHHPDYTDKQLTALAILVLAEFYACRFVFGMVASEAGREADRLMEYLRPQLTNSKDVDQAVRAWEWTEGWLASNRSHFFGSSSDFTDQPIYGAYEGQSWYVIASIMDDALLKAGFSPRKIAHEFAIRGWTRRPPTETDGTVRNKVKRRISGTPVWCYEIPTP